VSLSKEGHNCELVTDSSQVCSSPPLCTYRASKRDICTGARPRSVVDTHRRVLGAGIHTTLDGPSDLGEVATRAGTPQSNVRGATDLVCRWTSRCVRAEGQLEDGRLLQRVPLFEAHQLGSFARLPQLGMCDSSDSPGRRRRHDRLPRASSQGNHGHARRSRC
jgi:hypothetical protein